MSLLAGLLCVVAMPIAATDWSDEAALITAGTGLFVAATSWTLERRRERRAERRAQLAERAGEPPEADPAADVAAFVEIYEKLEAERLETAQLRATVRELRAELLRLNDDHRPHPPR